MKNREPECVALKRAARRESSSSWLGSQLLNSWPSGRNVTKGCGLARRQDFEMTGRLKRLRRLLGNDRPSYIPG